MALRLKCFIKCVNIYEIFHEIFQNQNYRILYITILSAIFNKKRCVRDWTIIVYISSSTAWHLNLDMIDHIFSEWQFSSMIRFNISFNCRHVTKRPCLFMSKIHVTEIESTNLWHICGRWDVHGKLYLIRRSLSVMSLVVQN